MGFSRKFRLISKYDFQSMFIQPRRASYNSFLALHKPNQKSHARLGIIVQKQYVKLAVQRNLLRRLIRESFRHHKEALKGLDILVLLRSKWGSLDKNALRDDLEKLWAKLIA